MYVHATVYVHLYVHICTYMYFFLYLSLNPNLVLILYTACYWPCLRVLCPLGCLRSVCARLAYKEENKMIDIFDPMSGRKELPGKG